MNPFKIALTGLFFALLLAACNQSPDTNNAANGLSNNAGNVISGPAPTPDELALGESKFREFCMKCHKEDGTGGKVEIEGKTLKPENLTSDEMKKEPDSEYIEYMEDGIPDEGMPSFKNEMTEDEMKAVVKFIREKLQKH